MSRSAALNQMRAYLAGHFNATLADALVWESYDLGRIFHRDGIPVWYVNATET